MFDEEIVAAINRLIEQWNVAERRIKAAEQESDGRVVYVAVSELRYAGRKFVDACQLLASASRNAEERKRALRYLSDATEDCVKAKHDAIDAAVDYVISWFKHVEDRLGLPTLVKYFPEYIDTLSMLYPIQRRIAESRANRTDGRDDIYNDIEKDYYQKILKLYEKMRQSHDRIRAEVEKEEAEFEKKQNREKRLYTIAIGSFLAALAGVALAGLTLLR